MSAETNSIPVEDLTQDEAAAELQRLDGAARRSEPQGAAEPREEQPAAPAGQAPGRASLHHGSHGSAQSGHERYSRQATCHGWARLSRAPSDA